MDPTPCRMTILNHLVWPSSIFVSCTCDHPPPSMLPFLCNVTLKPHDAPPASIEPTTRLMSPWFCDVRLGFRPTRSTLKLVVKSPSHGPTKLFARGQCRCLGRPGPSGEPQCVPPRVGFRYLFPKLGLAVHGGLRLFKSMLRARALTTSPIPPIKLYS